MIQAFSTEGASPLRFAPFLLCAVLAACGPYPRDIEGTLDAIERDGRLRVGFSELTADDEATARDFVARLAAATGAQPRLAVAPLETQLGHLEEGKLDIVIADFREDSPWARSVTIVEPLETRHDGSQVMELAPAVRNGENRWVALVERVVRDGHREGRP